MARGFDSKGAAEYAHSREERRKAPRLDADEMALRKKREELELTRTNIRRQVETATNENRRAQLKAALAHIEAEIAKL